MSEQAVLIPAPVGEVTRILVSDIGGAENVLAPTALAESMLKLGQLQPIVVERLAPGVGRYVVMAGRRRLAAARQLGWTHIDAVVYDTGQVNSAVVGLTENAQRSASPLVEMRLIVKLMQVGLDEHQVQQQTGMSVATIRKRLELAHLTDDLLVELERGRMAIGVAEQAAKLTQEQQRLLLESTLESKRITAEAVREAREVARTAAWEAADLGLPTPPSAAVFRSWRDDALSHLEASYSVVPPDEHAIHAAYAHLNQLLKGGDDVKEVA